ncbi:hypothetical protein GJAV_G00083330 [Gymnothorax javanicus]|nr:hypothetical protein GJAV_G00083330 [Gymnothorax javanicus]
MGKKVTEGYFYFVMKPQDGAIFCQIFCLNHAKGMLLFYRITEHAVDLSWQTGEGGDRISFYSAVRSPRKEEHTHDRSAMWITPARGR